MEKQMRKRWYEHEEKVLRRMPDGLEIQSPAQINSWNDDMRCWPPVCYYDIFNYFVMSECVDAEAMDRENCESMDSYNYFISQKVGALYSSSPAEDFVYVKGDVIPSLAVNSERHHAWVLLTTTGVIETAGCTCKAGQEKTCSHAGAILWKLDHATSAGTGRSAEAFTDSQQQWNVGTRKNNGPKRISRVCFKRHKFGVDEHRAAKTSKRQGFSLPPIRQYLTHTEMKNAFSDEKCSVRNLALLPGTMLYKVLNAQVPEATTTCDLHHNEHTDATPTSGKCASTPVLGLSHCTELPD